MQQILVVDDSPANLQLIEIILVAAGYRVRTCATVKNAFQMLRSDTFDLVITDICMPDKDGLEMIREGRRIYPNVPILAISGMSGSRAMLEVAAVLGACQTLQKPFSKADLLNAVAAALETERPSQREPT